MSVTNQSATALLQSVLQASQNGVLVYKGIHDATGTLTDLQLTMINAAAERSLGCSSVEAIGQPFNRIHPYWVGTDLVDRYQHVISTGQPARFEFTFNQPGQGLPTWWDISAVRLEENCVVVSCQDITQSKADAKASRLNSLWQKAFDVSVNGITVFDAIYDGKDEVADFEFVMINDAGVRLGGYKREELLGRTLWEIYPATKINGLFNEYVQVCKTGQPIEKEHYYPEYDIWRKVKIVPLPMGVMVSYTDITAIKKPEETVRKQAELLKRVLEGVPVGIAVLDVIRSGENPVNRPPDFRIGLINSLLADILGQSEEIVVGKKLTDVFVDANASGLLSRCITGVEEGVVQEFELPFALGKKAGWFRVSMAPKGEQLILAMTEVTEIKRAQLGHHRQVELLNSVLNGSQNSIIALESVRDTTGRIVDFQYVLQNDAHRRRTGRSDYQLLGRTMLELFPLCHNLFDQYIEVVLTGQPFRTETEFDYGGGTGWYDVSAVKREDGIVLTIQDKSAQKLAERQLHDQAQLLKTISDNTPAGLVLWEPVREETPERRVIDFRYCMTNLMNTYVTGHSAETLIGQDLLTMFPRFRGTELELALRETLETGRTQRMVFTYYREDADGWFDAQFIRIGNGQSTDKVLMTYMDVTEAHQTQLVQRQQADLMKLVIDAQPTGIVLYEPVRENTTDDKPGKIVDFTFVLANETQRQLLGRSNQELIGHRMRELFPSESAQEFFEFMVEVAETGQPKEWLLPYFSDGVRGWFQSALISHGDQVLFTFLDVTGLKRQQQVLEVTNQELRRSNENLQKFAYVASHDLQEPLRKIQSFGDVLVSTCGPALDAIGLDMINRMQGSARRMSELIRHLLTYSRLSTQLVEVNPVPLTDLLTKIIDDLAIPIQESNATIEFGNLPVVYGDEGQLRQLFQNLVSNAVKYRLSGVAPRVQIACQKVRSADLPVSAVLTTVISSETGNTPYYYQINVTDNGIGFDEKYLDRIFEVFQRLHGKKTYEGTGIGLAICLKVVQNHQGALTATSRPGKGATFSVYLPVPDANTTN
ncbi:PAS domain-containing protein [Spirosoma fluviale]|uniref:histidine kinase n=1 Tax=Spirosoma fluviale TaxID=1597977 RepID=A0A286GCS6_9BACT|nr:PAS domain-containing protein [Spirosoma fluviale]SOD92804.1 PAS domain S-box-containing protein [Spirosoma fluviale]